DRSSLTLDRGSNLAVMQASGCDSNLDVSCYAKAHESKYPWLASVKKYGVAHFYAPVMPPTAFALPVTTQYLASIAASCKLLRSSTADLTTRSLCSPMQTPRSLSTPN